MSIRHRIFSLCLATSLSVTSASAAGELYEQIPDAATSWANVFLDLMRFHMSQTTVYHNLALEGHTQEAIERARLGRAFIVLEMNADSSAAFAASHELDPRPFVSYIRYDYEILVDDDRVGWLMVRPNRGAHIAYLRPAWLSAGVRGNSVGTRDPIDQLWSRYPPDDGYVVTQIDFWGKVGSWILVFGPDGFFYDDRHESETLAEAAADMRKELLRSTKN